MSEYDRCIEALRLAYSAFEAVPEPANLLALKRSLLALSDALRRSEFGASAQILSSPGYRKIHEIARARMLPTVEDRIIAALPSLSLDLTVADAAPPPAMLDELLDVQNGLAAWLAAAPPDRVPRFDESGHGLFSDRPRRVVVEIERRVALYVGALSDELERPDPPDIRILSANQLRIELLGWICTLSGTPSAADDLRSHAKVIARMILRRVSTLMLDFLRDGTAPARVDAATAFLAIDDLLLLVLRVIEGNGEEHEGMSFTFGDSMGVTVLEEFSVFLERFLIRTLNDALRGMEQPDRKIYLVDAALNLLERVATLALGLDAATQAREAETDRPAVERLAIVEAERAMAASRLLAIAQSGVRELAEAIVATGGITLSPERRRDHREAIDNLTRMLAHASHRDQPNPT